MLLDAETTPLDHLAEADLVIIGAGAAGITLALACDGTPLKVVLLESGGLAFERRTQALYRGRNIGLRYEPLDLCRVRTFGGSTDKRGWAGWCKIFAELDFEPRDWVRLSGWPFPRRELMPFYAKALQTVWLPADIEERACRDAEAGDCLALGGTDCVNDPVPLSTCPQLGPAWLDQLKRSGNVTVVLHANVTRIETDASGRHVTAIRYATLTRRQFRLRPRATVLAAGGIENARLLLVSNQTVRTGIGNGSDWVGRCFMDHPRFAWGQITATPDPKLLRRYNPTHGVGQRRMGVPPPGAAPLFGGGIALCEATQRREKVLGSRTWILPVAAQGERPAGRELRELVLWATRLRVPVDVLLRTGKVVADLPNAAAAAVAHLQSIAGVSRRWQFLTILEPEPNPDSRVTLSRDLDPLGLPRVDVDWQLTPLAEHSLARTQAIVTASLSQRGIDCAVVGPGGARANQTVSEPRWVWHHMGTTRMSRDAAQGVVDTDCRVHGMSNLYVAGSSIFPTCSTDMPTLTLMALAGRLAQHLKNELRGGEMPLGEWSVVSRAVGSRQSAVGFSGNG